MAGGLSFVGALDVNCAGFLNRWVRWTVTALRFPRRCCYIKRFLLWIEYRYAGQPRAAIV